MKRIFLFLGIILSVFGCDKDEVVVFNADIREATISFTPVPGGAIMNYVLPDNSEIFSIQAVYKNTIGKKSTVTSSYLNTSVELPGFIDERTDVPVELRLLDKNGNASEPVSMTFSTMKSSAKALFDNVEVSPFWNGFQVKYNGALGAKGFLHVGRLGLNTISKKIDTLVIKSYPLLEGEQKMNFVDQYDPETLTTDVILWTEDHKGNFIKKQVFDGVEALFDAPLNTKDYTWEGPSQEDEYYKFSWKYIFDGDTKGIKAYEEIAATNFYIFVSPPNGVGQYWIIDMGQEEMVSRVRIHQQVYFNMYFTDYHESSFMAPQAPNHVKVYSSNDKTLPLEEWQQIGEFFQSRNIPTEETYVYRAFSGDHYLTSRDMVLAANEIYCDVPCDVAPKRRYIAVEILSTFDTFVSDSWMSNSQKRVNMSEIEVYGQK